MSSSALKKFFTFMFSNFSGVTQSRENIGDIYMLVNIIYNNNKKHLYQSRKIFCGRIIFKFNRSIIEMLTYRGAYIRLLYTPLN